MTRPADRHPGTRPPHAVGTGAAAAVLLTLLLVGIPAGLVAVGAVPSGPPTWAQIVSRLSHPDLDGSMVRGILAVVGWASWATFAVAVVLEVPAALRGRTPRRLRAIGVQQRVAAALIGAVVAMGAASPAVATAADHDARAALAMQVATLETVLDRTAGKLDAPSAFAVGSAPAAQSVSDSATVASLGTGAGEGGAGGAAQDPIDGGQSYVVRPGDSLWRVAERTLGSGERFREIASLNYGVPQPDGASLDRSHWLRPGWVLRLPSDASSPDTGSVGAEASTAQTAAGTHVVQPGESLSSIASAELDDPDRYPELYAASAGIEQPDGGRLTDPDVIRPGWRIQLPDAGTQERRGDVASAPTAEASAPTAGSAGESASVAPSSAPSAAAPASPAPVVPSPAVPPPASSPAPAVSPSPMSLAPAVSPSPASLAPAVPSSVPAASAVPAADESAVGAATSASSIDMRTVGIGATLAAGLLALMAARRLAARRARGSGRRLALPRLPLEPRLRSVADTGVRRRIDAALSALATACAGQPLPAVLAIRALPEGHLELYLDEAARLPVPWCDLADGHVWRLDRSASAANEDLPRPVTTGGNASRLTPDGTDAPSPDAQTGTPYPALATVGRDEEGADVLVDLERLGVLDLRGDDEAVRAVLAALAVELATGAGPDDLQVTLVGDLAELPGVVDTGRLRHVPDLSKVGWEVGVQAEDLRLAVAQAGASSLVQARATGRMPDAWTPEILFVACHAGAADRPMLEELATQGRVPGAAAVTANAGVGTWRLEMQGDGRAVLQPAGLVITPQRLDRALWAETSELLADISTREGPTWAKRLPDAVEPQLASIPVRIVAGEEAPPGAASASVALAAAEESIVSDGEQDLDATLPRPLSPTHDRIASLGPVATGPQAAATMPTAPSATPPATPSAVKTAGIEPGIETVAGESLAPADWDPLGVGPLDLGPLEPLDYGPWAADSPEPAMNAAGETTTAPAEQPAVGSTPTERWLASAAETAAPAPARSDAAPAPARSDAAPAPARSDAAPAPARSDAAPAPRTARPPVLRVLGPVGLDVASGIELPSSHRRQATELIAYLLFHPGADGRQLSQALWPSRDPNPTTRRSAVSRARRWLGRDPSGHEYLPRFRDPAQPERRGYRLVGVTSDWARFIALIGDDVTVTPLPTLHTALALVQGPPFADVPPRRYAWADPLVQEMTASVVDVAHDVARRCLLAGDIDGAREAARVGRLVDPADERTWRDAIRAEWAAGRRVGITRLVEQLRDHLDSLDLEAEPETEDLIDEVNLRRSGIR